MFRDNTTFRPCMLYIQVYIHAQRSVWKRITKDKSHKNSAPAATGKRLTKEKSEQLSLLDCCNIQNKPD